MPPEVERSVGWQKLLPSKLRLALWKRVDRRLQHGDMLITTTQFQELIEREFLRLVKVKPSPKISLAIREMVERVNEEHPNKYLSMGIKNMMAMYTRTLLSRLEGHSEEALKEGRQRLKDMVRDGRTALFLESIGIEVGPKGVSRSVGRAIERILEGEQIEVDPQVVERKKQRRRGSGMAAVRISAAALEAEQDAEGPAQLSLPGAEECQEREQHMVVREQEIAAEETGRASEYLDSYCEQDLIDEEEKSALQAAYGIDEELASGKINLEEAERRRSKIGLREQAEKKLQVAVSYAVRFINACEGLQRLPRERDGVCRLLIRHKEAAIAESDEEMGELLGELDADEALLEGAMKMLERRDHEVRMLAANLPPYRHVTGQGKIGNWLIEESFIDELRAMDREQMSQQFNSDDPDERVRLAAGVRCLIALINQLVAPTPLHIAVVRLHIGKTVARLYSSMPQAKNGRQKVSHYLKQRIPRLYPDLNAEQREDIDKESEEIMASIEAEREEGGDAKDEMRVYRV